jgi:hypothetical protein
LTDEPKLVFFPSMNRVPVAASPNETDFEREQRERKNTHIARHEQRRKEVEQRKLRIQIAMRSLPLKQGAELQIPSLVQALESTFNAVQAEIPVANPKNVEEQLAKAADFAEQFATYLEQMETAATSALVRAMDGDVVRLVDLQWQLIEFYQRADLARGEYLAFDAPPAYLVKRSAKRGAKVKKLPDAMRRFHCPVPWAGAISPSAAGFISVPSVT